MNIDNSLITFAGAGLDPVKHKFLGAGDFKERKILRGRADEDEVVIFGVIEGEKAAAFDTNSAMKEVEDVVEFVDTEDLSDAGVMIENGGIAVALSIAVPHASFRAAHEGSVAENDPGFILAGDEAVPKNLEGGRSRLAGGSGAGWNRVARGHQPDDDGDGRSKKNGERNDFGTPAASGTLVQVRDSGMIGKVICRFVCGSIAVMEGRDVGAFWKVYDEVVVGAVGAVILVELGTEASGLDADHRVDLGVEVGGTTEDFRRNLKLLDGCAGMIDRVFGEVAKEFAEGLGAMQGMAGS